jgi:phosphatidylserine/phosphatidylglycerophosphate/cardiolipin synthase-like enzyme
MDDVLRPLSDADLRALAAALRSGRLSAPFPLPAVQRFCTADHSAAAAQRFRALADEGMRPEHLALLLETAARARAHRPGENERIELVWTGPEVVGKNRDTGVVVREMFASARASVLVAGYAVYQGREVFRTLAERMQECPDLHVRLVLDVHRQHADSCSGAEIVARFARRFRENDWPWPLLPEVFFDPRSLEVEATRRSSMHAKCVVIDRQTAFVSSANFTEAAQQRNIEAGVLIRSEPFAIRLGQQFEALVTAGLLLPLSL